jgi:Tfp pilus assembly protein PilN
MRPVNLIPAEDRPGGTRPLRSGPIAYVLVGALALAVIGVAVLVVSGNQVSERKAEVVQLEGERTAAEAQAQSLAAYTQFDAVREQRVATVTRLADSRFDWERVMRELTLILPHDVWLTSLTGSASPSANGVEGGGSSVALRASIAGPALELIGCASGQEAVAGFVQALKEIGGVTRVGVQASALGSSEGGEGSTCQTRNFIAQFQMVVAFDAAPPPEATTPTETAPPAEATTTEAGG